MHITDAPQETDMPLQRHCRRSRHTSGFTLVEMSVVLVIIALVVGAMTVGRDVYRSAAAERLSHDFVQAWVLAYQHHVDGAGVVPGDNFDNPSGRVNNGLNNFLCDDNLLNAMLARGVTLPAGRAEGLNNRYVYQDSRGQPHELRACFGAVQWSEPQGSVGNYGTRTRNVLRLEGLTPELARLLDSKVDGGIDARHGQWREAGMHDANVAAASPWSLESDDTMSGFTGPDEQEAEVSAYLRMTQ
ncbi:prepilin-type N-terminal cleavage/methylation domain-containing protein [Luteimonas cucumeris]|uniref:Prepilin-type N-terminal cleavage/methylation domain-containing protein n=2 Tax=Luteimonas cucumeris TaxID=985012 RepID=A0A562LF33_9GAMM|nr:prepilin-type N-terminal cleavage/methylation domain-containing protein [Luteimonas cucumeris]